MVTWNKTDSFEYVNWVCHLLSAAAIFYLLVRHALLLSGHLEPDTLKCGDCTRACISSMSDRCATHEPDNTVVTTRPRSHSQANIHSWKLHTRVIFYCTFGSLIWYLIFCLNGAMILMSQADIGWLPFAYCRFAKTVASLSYAIAKSCLYCVLIARLHVGFDGSAYAISKRVIYALYAFVGIGALIFVSAAIVVYRGEAEKHGCETKAPVFFVMFGSLFDMVFTVYVIFAFVDALRKMLYDFTKHMDDSSREDHKKIRPDIYLLPVKYTLLGTVATLSTMFSMALFALAGVYFILPLDCVFNSAVLVLMTGKWMPAFVLVCTPVLKCLAHAPCLPCASLSESQLMEVAATRQRNLSALGSAASSSEFSL